MADADFKEEAQGLYDQLPDDVDVTVERIQEQLATTVGEYNVPIDEARRSIISSYTDDDGDDFDQEPDEVSIEEIDKADEWVSLTAKVVDLWEPRSDKIGQVGLLGDETGTLKFTKWAKSDLPELDEGVVYRLENVVTDEYQGQYSVTLNRTSTIDSVDEGMEVNDNSEEVEGALVDVQDGSGLIKRCPKEDCTRALRNGRCSDHGKVEGEFDLRVKGVIDDGETVQKTIFDAEATEDLTGLSLDEAKEMAIDDLDKSVVVDEIREQVIGRYYRLSGPILGQNLLVDEVEPVTEKHDPEEILIQARSIQL